MKAIAIIAACALATGCATTGYTDMGYAPIVDMAGVQGSTYQADLDDCQQYAQQRAGAGTGAVAGAVAGAVFGLLLNAAIGGGYRSSLAGVGALSGAASGATAGEGTQRDIIRRCLSGRGYRVLD